MLNTNRIQMVGIIIDIVRRECYEQGLIHGAIGIGVSLEKRHRAIFDWAEMPESAVSEITIAPITPNDDTLCYDENGEVAEDGAETVGIKIAGLRRLLSLFDEEQIGVTERSRYTSAAIPDWMVISGLSKKKGAIAIVINTLVDTHAFYGERAITFYIAVSGGTEEQNKAAALSAFNYIDDEVQKVPTLLLSSMVYMAYYI